jgi:hypothetical protein
MNPLLAGNVVFWHLLREWDHIKCCEMFEYAQWSFTLIVFKRRLKKHLVAMYKLRIWRVINVDV